ncbi:ALP1-like protein isoform X1 [Tanacetum coccineum]
MSDSSFSDSYDLDDIAEYEMIMKINNEDQDEVEAVRMRRYINRERDVAEERANNDITVLHHSPLFDDLLADNEPVAPYVVNGQPFDKGYAISEAGEIYICPQQNILRTWVERCAIRQRKAKELRDKQTHSRLQRSLIEHVWALHQP